VTPVKFGLFYVGVAIATAVGDGLLRAIGRRSAVAGWTAALFLLYGAAVLVLHARALRWPAMVALPVLALPVAAAVIAVRRAPGPSRRGGSG
jgi:hypothetical protein